jgi:hypothetical protein
MAALEREIKVYEGRGKRAKPHDIWQDLFAKYVALVDPGKGRARWDEWGSVELGDTRTHAQHWLSFLASAGPVNLSVTANTSFYAVFGQGDRKTYLVYNPGPKEHSVAFSDGKVITAAPGRLTVI